MPVRVGIDLVDVNDVRETLSAHGARYLERVYGAGEIADCQLAGGVDPERLAARFAAKEAVIKVLRAGEEGIPWRAIEVRRDPAGWIDLRLSGAAAELAAATGLGELAVSISHERGFAAAVVVAELHPAVES